MGGRREEELGPLLSQAPARGLSSPKSQMAPLTKTLAYSTGPTKSKPTAKKSTRGEGEGPEERTHSLRPLHRFLKMAVGVADERDSRKVKAASTCHRPAPLISSVCSTVRSGLTQSGSLVSRYQWAGLRNRGAPLGRCGSWRVAHVHTHHSPPCWPRKDSSHPGQSQESLARRGFLWPSPKLLLPPDRDQPQGSKKFQQHMGPGPCQQTGPKEGRLWAGVAATVWGEGLRGDSWDRKACTPARVSTQKRNVTSRAGTFRARMKPISSLESSE